MPLLLVIPSPVPLLLLHLLFCCYPSCCSCCCIHSRSLPSFHHIPFPPSNAPHTVPVVAAWGGDSRWDAVPIEVGVMLLLVVAPA